MHTTQFTYGLLTPVLSFAASYIGCLLGLMCSSRAQVLTGGARAGWLMTAAIAVGGTGLWVMHFVAMLGFSMGSVQIRYRVLPTLLSIVIAVLAVGLGLAIAGSDVRKVHRIVGAAIVTGVGAATMHEVGMFAMVLPGTMTEDPLYLALCVLAAVLAAGLLMVCTLVANRPSMVLTMPLLIAAGFSTMHYTGMAAMRMSGMAMGAKGTGMSDTSMDDMTAVSFNALLTPLLLVVSVVTVILLVFVSFSASPAELIDEARFESRLARLERGEGRPTGPIPQLAARRTDPLTGRRTAADRPESGLIPARPDLPHPDSPSPTAHPTR